MWLLPSSHLDEQSLEKSHGGAGVVSNERARRVLLLQKSWLSPKIPRKVTFIPLLFLYCRTTSWQKSSLRPSAALPTSPTSTSRAIGWWNWKTSWWGTRATSRRCTWIRIGCKIFIVRRSRGKRPWTCYRCRTISWKRFLRVFSSNSSISLGFHWPTTRSPWLRTMPLQAFIGWVNKSIRGLFFTYSRIDTTILYFDDADRRYITVIGFPISVLFPVFICISILNIIFVCNVGIKIVSTYIWMK